MRNVVEVRNVYKRFWFTSALENISLTIRDGEHTLLLGPNGSGKSTLIKIVAGLIKPTKGEVRVLGLDPFRSNLLGRKVNVLLDDFSLPFWMSGYKFLRYIAKIRGLDWNKVKEVAKEFNITSYWHKLIGVYSAGMKKKIALIQALIGAPRIIILDDPFTALDIESRVKLLEVLVEKGREATIIVSTHSLFGAQRICKKTVLLDNGRKIMEGDTEEVVKALQEKSYTIAL